MSKRVIKKKVELLQEMIDKIKVCERCGSKENLTLDHIVPKQILSQFGLNEEDTLHEFYLQLYCRRCNTFKGMQLDTANPRTKKILLFLLNI